MEIKSRRCTFSTRPGIVEGSEGEGEVGGTKRGNSRRQNGVGGGIQDLPCALRMARVRGRETMW